MMSNHVVVRVPFSIDNPFSFLISISISLCFLFYLMNQLDRQLDYLTFYQFKNQLRRGDEVFDV